MKWPQRLLGEVADLSLGKMLDQNKNRGEFRPYLANINVRWGGFDLSTMREMKFELGDLERYGVRYGDIVMCEGGEPGRCAIWKDKTTGVMIQKALHRIRPYNFVDGNFLFYQLFKMGRNNEFSGLFTGSAIKHFPKEKLSQIKVSLPLLHEQRRISEVLSSYDDLIENNQRRIALLEESARLLYREWFVHFRFPGHEHVKIVDGLPQGWAMKELSELCIPHEGIQTGPFGSQLHQSDYCETGVPVVMPRDIKHLRVSIDEISYVSEGMAEKLDRHRLKIGDIVYGRRGEIGRRAFIGEKQEGWICGTGCLRIRADSSKINQRYLFESLGADQSANFIKSQAKGSTMLNLNAGSLRRVPTLCPPQNMQNYFVEIIRPHYAAVECLFSQNQKLAQARDLLLPRLMSGEISV